MHRKSLLAGFVAGAATVVVAMILSSAGRTMPRAMAQNADPRVVRPGGEAPTQGQAQGAGVVGGGAVAGGAVAGPAAAPGAAAASPRYQISAWAQSGGPGGGAARGAFVIDLQNGRIWELDSSQGKLKPVGQVDSR
jgi:hypothetical protein